MQFPRCIAVLLLACVMCSARGAAAQQAQPLIVAGRAASPAVAREDALFRAAAPAAAETSVSDAAAEDLGSGNAGAALDSVDSAAAPAAAPLAVQPLTDGASLQRASTSVAQSPPPAASASPSQPPPARAPPPSRQQDVANDDDRLNKLRRDAQEANFEAQISASQASAAEAAQAAATMATLPRMTTGGTAVAGQQQPITVTVTIAGATTPAITTTVPLSSLSSPSAAGGAFSDSGSPPAFSAADLAPGGLLDTAPSPYAAGLRSSSSSCAALWGQCGGTQNWMGATCCASSSAQCVAFDSGYAQCKPCNAIGEQWYVHAPNTLDLT
jgi:hypothetical protein